MSKNKLMVVDPDYQGDIRDAHPALKKLRTTCVTDMDAYIRYMAWCFDPYSPMIRKYPDLRKRRQAAMDAVGYKGIRDPALESAFICNVVKNRLWTEICNNETTFDEFSDLNFKPITEPEGGNEETVLKAAERKIKLLEAMGKIRPKIDELYTLLYEGDEDLIKEKPAVTKLTAEMVAKAAVK